MAARDRRQARRRQRSSLLAGALVALLAGLALTITHHSLHPPVGSRAAIAVALRDKWVRDDLAGSHWTRVASTPIDAQLERVSFWSGGRLVAEAAVGRSGRVVSAVDDHRQRVPYGDWLAYEPALLIGLCLMFGLATMVTPWRRMRNLDALAAVSVVVPVILFQHRYLDVSEVAAVPPLLYLLARCAWRALGPARSAAASTPLLTVLTPHLSTVRRVRWLRVALLAVALIFVMVGVSSPDAVDVAYAVMEGATNLVHGVLPYGHMPPGIIHGDTYPILSYALYTPLAMVAPVRSMWYSVDGALVVAVLAALAGAWVTLRSVAGAARVRCGQAEVEEAGLRAALAVLSFPALLITASSGTTDVVMAAMLAAAILLWRRPAAGAGMLALAGWFKLAPFALVPVFLAPLRGRRLAAAVATISCVSLACVVLVIAVGGIGGVGAMLHAISYQFTRGSLQSIWSVLGIAGVQPLAQAGALGLIAGAAVKLWRNPRLGVDRTRMAALAAAILIALQLAADYWAFLYLIWFLPLLCASLFDAHAEPAPAFAAVDVAAPAARLRDALPA